MAIRHCSVCVSDLKYCLPRLAVFRTGWVGLQKKWPIAIFHGKLSMDVTPYPKVIKNTATIFHPKPIISQAKHFQPIKENAQ